MIPSTVERVPAHTAEHVNERIRRRTEENVARVTEGGPEAVSRHLKELDREWDTEPTLEANASLLAFTGVALGAFMNVWFLLLPAVVTAFLFQHALQGTARGLSSSARHGRKAEWSHCRSGPSSGSELRFIKFSSSLE